MKPKPFWSIDLYGSFLGYRQRVKFVFFLFQANLIEYRAVSIDKVNNLGRVN